MSLKGVLANVLLGLASLAVLVVCCLYLLQTIPQSEVVMAPTIVANQNFYWSLYLIIFLTLGALGLWKGLSYFNVSSFFLYLLLLIFSVAALILCSRFIDDAVRDSDTSRVLFWILMGAAGVVGIFMILVALGLPYTLAAIALGLLIIISELGLNYWWIAAWAIIFSLVAVVVNRE